MHLYELRRNFEYMLTKQVQDAMPFVLGKAINVAFLELIRFGKQILSFGDKHGLQPYQVIFMETVGFKVDQVFVTSWLKRHEIEETRRSESVTEILAARELAKERAIAAYKRTKNPIQKLEFKLN